MGEAADQPAMNSQSSSDKNSPALRDLHSNSLFQKDMTEPIEDVIEQHRRGQEREGDILKPTSCFFLKL